MTTLSITSPNDGETIDAADVSTPFNAIANVINGNIDSTNITAGGLTPANLVAGTGTSWAWQSFTPTWTNLTIGNGTLDYAKYIQIGKTIHFKIKLTFGSTTSVGGQITFTTPVTQTTLAVGDTIQGIASMADASVPDKKLGIMEYTSTTTLRVTASTADTNYTGAPAAAATSSTVPFTWATNDVLMLAGTLEAA